MVSKSTRIITLQSLRFVFCLFIFVFHYFRSVGSSGFEYGGDAGITFFFMLSGLVVSIGCGHSVETGNFQYVRFLRKRLAKLYPLHLLTFVVALFMGILAGVKFNLTKTILHLFLLQEFSLSEDIMNYGSGLSWFLGTLFFCYILFSFVYKRFVILHSVMSYIFLVLYISIAFALASRCTNAAIDNYVFAFPPLRVIDFIIGILIYRLYTMPISIRIKLWVDKQSAMLQSFVEIIIVAIFFMTWMTFDLLPSWLRFAPYFWLPFSLLIYWFAIAENSRGVISRILSQRMLVFLGNISFEIYMTHGIVINLCIFAWGRLLGYETVCNPIHFVLCLLSTIIVSSVINRLFLRS